MDPHPNNDYEDSLAAQNYLADQIIHHALNMHPELRECEWQHWTFAFKLKIIRRVNADTVGSHQ